MITMITFVEQQPSKCDVKGYLHISSHSSKHESKEWKGKHWIYSVYFQWWSKDFLYIQWYSWRSSRWWAVMNDKFC